MTNEEAVRELKAMKPHIESGMSIVGYDAYDMAISALEKQIPKKLKMPLDAYWTCPTCGTKADYPFRYCRGCGQAIKWEDEE